MKIFLTSVTSLMFCYLAVKQYVYNRRVSHPGEEKSRIVPYVDMALIFSIICNVVNTDGPAAALPCTIMSATHIIYLLSVSFLTFNDIIKRIVQTGIGMLVLTGVISLTSMSGIISQINGTIYIIFSLISTLLVAGLYIYGIYSRLRNVKYVMRAGSVWTNVTLSVDSVYLCILLIYSMAYAGFMLSGRSGSMAGMCMFTVLFTSSYVAVSVRILNTSAFVFMAEQERKIVESAKISQLDTVQENAGMTIMYKNLYDRILEYFTEYKPYLRHDLTINDVVEVLFSNKLYISKAISQFTGRNFCQFVNYYRVTHAIELFRRNTGLKVVELASLSGFNSSVSFGMAFKLYMGEKPGDWCRREKYRQDKQKK